MMNLEIRNVADNATDEERVVLYVLADCNLNDYLLFDSTYDEEGKISNKHRHLFVFPDQQVKKGDYIRIYTKEGNNEFLKFPLFTTKTQFYKKTIDYIFFSNKLKVHKILKLPSEEDVNKEKFLPSAEFPSDHLKLYAEFYFKK